MTDRWSPWQIYPDWQPDFPSFQETLDGGQAFCWFPEEDHTFKGIVSKIPLRLAWKVPGHVYWSSPTALQDEAIPLIERYLGTENTYKAYYNTLPWRSDLHLRRCMEAFPELRILGQPPDETLLGFMCSATKQIVQIKEMLNLLRQELGQSLTLGNKALPTWQALVSIPEGELRACKLGFRAANISKTAAIICNHLQFFKELEAMPYGSAKQRLCSLPGVGEKVADCVLLFGFHKLEAFPVDTWILKVMRRHYHLTDWNAKQVAHFGRQHFGSLAGLAQQFLFAWERNHGRK